MSLHPIERAAQDAALGFKPKPHWSWDQSKADRQTRRNNAKWAEENAVRRGKKLLDSNPDLASLIDRL